MFAAAVKHAKAEKLKYNKTHLQAPKKESRDIHHKAIQEFMIAGRKAQRRGEVFDIAAKQKAAEEIKRAKANIPAGTIVANTTPVKAAVKKKERRKRWPERKVDKLRYAFR